MATKRAAVKTPDKVAKPKRDKKAIKWMVVARKAIDKYLKRIGKTMPGDKYPRAALARDLATAINITLKREQTGWLLPSKKARKTAKKRR